MTDVSLWELVAQSDYPDPGSRLVVYIKVRDLSKSIPFYRHFLNVPPAALSDTYAAFYSDDPALHLILEQDSRAKGSSGHFGLQMKNTRLIEEARRRLVDSGFVLTDEDDVACCYAVQNKLWAADPDGNRWEMFVTTKAEAEEGCGPDCICHQDLARTELNDSSWLYTEFDGKEVISPNEEKTMSKHLKDMSTIHATEEGVDVSVKGDVEKQKIDEMLEECATGEHACCGPDFFERVKSINSSGRDGDVTIHIEGEVNEEMIAENLANCECYKP